MTAMFPDDPSGPIKNDSKRKGATPREVAAFHAGSDVDSSTFSQHHTLGVKHNQATYGDHSHDGKSSRLVGDGQNLTVSGAKGGNAALTSLIAMLQQVIKFTDNTT